MIAMWKTMINDAGQPAYVRSCMCVCVLLGESDINCILCGGVKSIPEGRKKVYMPHGLLLYFP